MGIAGIGSKLAGGSKGKIFGFRSQMPQEPRIPAGGIANGATTVLSVEDHGARVREGPRGGEAGPGAGALGGSSDRRAGVPAVLGPPRVVGKVHEMKA